jgi:hypothetical protein
MGGLTLKGRTRRLALATSSTGVCGDGWNQIAFTSPFDGAARLASRRRSIASVPCWKVRLLLADTSVIPPVDKKTCAIRYSSPSSSPERSEDADPDPEFLLLIFPPTPCFSVCAHFGAGWILSYCLRRRHSYSRPATASSVGASRSLGSRLAEARETWSVASSGSAHAAAEDRFVEGGIEGADSSSSCHFPKGCRVRGLGLSLGVDWCRSRIAMKR